MFGRILIGVVRGYRLVISPWTPPSCRFTPTCSAYAIEAIEQHGGLRGSWLALRRIARCHPWGGFGFDPVPSARSRRVDDVQLAPRDGSEGARGAEAVTS